MTDFVEYEQPQDPNVKNLKIVAICLIVSGCISIPAIAFDFIMRIINIYTGKLPHSIKPGFEAGFKIGVWGSAILEVLAVLLTVVMILGAIQMLRLRSYNFARLAAILAIIPLTGFCCCILDVPFGIWALIFLLKPEVKAAFQ